ncbi:COG1361 S-layer family protein [Methanoplanus endosymbiosus]|uniref:S-layer protein n=1 Tax=Methanoplanus endosymbiosus TaxID=33865 RepID=A0A9E7TKU1_9EURY|nr:S-layer protein [Methanoplanus endosymbiosus]UUX93089.1 S-layer protein [Methanoplanus endosymbiosus]
MKKISLYLFVVFLVFAAVIIPVSAGDKFYSNGPELSAAVQGTNELAPGLDGSIVILVENRGLIDMKFVKATDITPDYSPTTAKAVKATLISGNSPLTVKSDPQILGDIPSGYYKPAEFEINIPQDAKEGDYELLLKVDYDYMYNADQSGTDEISYTFKKVSEEIPVRIVIKPSLHLSIKSVRSEELYAGGEGYVTMEIKNDGSDDGTETAVFIQPVGKSPVTPVEDSVYVGDMNSGDSVSVRFKVSVSKDADPTQVYPMQVYATYNNYEDQIEKTAPVSVGIGFKGKIRFKSTGDPTVVSSGEDALIYVTYKNTGDSTAYQAEGRISVVDPFSSDDSNVYLGDLKPGDSVQGVYKVKVSADATAKEYALDSEVRYNDAENNNYVSDTVKVLVTVDKKSDSMMLIAGFLVLVILLGVGAWFYSKKKNGK